VGPSHARNGAAELTRYLLDTTTLIAHLRGDKSVHTYLLGLLANGHALSTSCVNIAEVEHGLRPKDRKAAAALLDRLDFLETTREAGRRAGRYQADFQQQGQTIHTPDALVAGTARVHGAIVVTDNLSDFPMTDVRSEAPPTE
jgi:predicted nucleic acid-binding protein